MRKESITDPVMTKDRRRMSEMKWEYPAGPRIDFLLARIGQLLPWLIPFGPLAFALDISRKLGDIAHYQVGPLHIYQLNSPELIRQILVDEPERVFGLAPERRQRP
jgi:hypothetical protein